MSNRAVALELFRMGLGQRQGDSQFALAVGTHKYSFNVNLWQAKMRQQQPTKKPGTLLQIGRRVSKSKRPALFPIQKEIEAEIRSGYAIRLQCQCRRENDPDQVR